MVVFRSTSAPRQSLTVFTTVFVFEITKTSEAITVFNHFIYYFFTIIYLEIAYIKKRLKFFVNKKFCMKNSNKKRWAVSWNNKILI